MKQTFSTHTGAFLLLGVIAMVITIVAWPSQSASAARDEKKKGLFQRTSSLDEGVPSFWDIREAKGEQYADALLKFRNANQKDASLVADVRDGFVRGEEQIKSRIPGVKIEYNNDIRIPEVIAPDVQKQKFGWLTGESSVARVDLLRNFLKQNTELVGVDAAQIDGLDVTADYTNPAGNLSFVHLEQRINGVPVFRGEVKAGFTTKNEIVRVINNLAPGIDHSKVSTDFRDPSDAVRAAASHINHELRPEDQAINPKQSTEFKTVFGSGDWATTAEKMYFPTEPGVAVPAWRVLIWRPVNAYYVIVDATDGVALWHKNLTEDQTQSATYNIYGNSNAYIHVADSPFPLSPGPVNPTLGTQGAAISRTSITLIGNEAPYTFNNLGWITDGNNTTDGNNVQAGLDRKLPNTGNPANPNDTDPDGMAIGSPNRVFNFPINPGNPNTNGGDPPIPSGAPGTCLGAADPSLPTDYQKAITTQLFYIVNRYHDEMYRLGFTEAARNFQNANFTAQGVGNDRVAAQAQDCSGTNNANMTTPADGSRPTMQMYLWTGPTPDFDGSLDAEVVIHEHTHGLSNRLHNNSGGLTTNMSRGMGEGWSDFYSYAMLAEPGDAIDGIYTTGGYATYLIAAGFTGNYYYGIRRFPRAPITFVGPNGLPHNPYTFRYVNSNCNTLIGTTTSNPPPNSAYPRGPIGSATCDQVHNLGEIWSSALWEVRNRMVARLGFAAGTTRALQVITDGMKLAPTSPTFLQERDAIVAAAAALPLAPEASADVIDVRDGFRVRGMGFSASIQNAGSGSNNTAVTEAFDVPNAIFTNPNTVSDSTGDNDGFPEPGENVLLSIPITNNSGAPITNVVASVTGGGSGNYGTINDGQTVVRQISYPIPAGATCGSMHQVNITGTSDLGAMNPTTFSFRLGAPVGGAPVTFTNATLMNIPAGQPGTTMGVAAPYSSDLVVSGLTGNKVITLELTQNNHIFAGDMDILLEGPGGQKFIVMSDAFETANRPPTTVTTTMVIRDGAAATMPATGVWPASADFRPTNHVSGDTFAAPAPAAPYQSPAPIGTATFASVFGSDGTTMNGTWRLWVVDDAAQDTGTMAGWKLTFEANDFTCSVATAAEVEVSGRVLTADGRGVTNASVTITDENGQSQTVVTGRNGRYMFEGVEAGQTYIVSVGSRRFTYSPRVIEINDNVTDLDFVPE